ncbi:MAG: ribosomal protein S18-alanine N-acetyltransferase [Actinomycetes bacterium]
MTVAMSSGRVDRPSVVAPEIAPMRRRHLRGVMAIETAANSRPWSTRLFADELRMPMSRLYLVALDDHEVVGYAGLMITLDEGHVTNVAVHPEHRRRHIGTMLMLVLMRRAVERGVVDMTLEVRQSNRAAQELYRHLGFAPGGARTGYYPDTGEDALIMWAHGIDAPEHADRLRDLEASLPVRLNDHTSALDPLAAAREDAVATAGSADPLDDALEYDE